MCLVDPHSQETTKKDEIVLCLQLGADINEQNSERRNALYLSCLVS